MTGTFDDWGKTVQLDHKDGIFEKEVQLPETGEKIYYKVSAFVFLYGSKKCDLPPRQLP